MEEFITNNTRIIAKRDDGALLATNHPTATLNDILETCFILDEKKKILSPIVTIGSITKFDNWYEEDYYLRETNLVEDALLGFAVGDAFGVPVESLEREDIKYLDLVQMIGNGVHNVPKGAWSDDTSMLISSMDSIINNNCINYEDIMNNFIKWLDSSKFTSIDETFGVGATTLKALTNYKKTNDVFNSGCKEDIYNGNGSLMRILPFSLYCILNNLDDNETRGTINTASALTHSNNISKMGCYIYTEFLREIINSKDKVKAFEYILNKDYTSYGVSANDAYAKLLDENFIEVSEEEIKSSGYVVDTLESVIYSILNTRSYKSSIITSVNLGGDTDTIAALTGAISGILYSSRTIPREWIDCLLKKDYLIELANKFNNLLNEKNKTKQKERK